MNDSLGEPPNTTEVLQNNMKGTLQYLFTII